MATRPIPSPVIPETRTVREDAPSPTWADVSESVAAGKDEVILESEGLPAVAVISLAEYAAFRKAREQERAAAALKWFREFQESYDGRNDDLSDEEVMELAVRATKETRNELWEERQRQLREAKPSNPAPDHI